jgi:tungstate transport system ATP-binding protein
MGEMLIGLNDVSVALNDKTVLARVRLRVNAGERVIILGANGAGKSTLLRVAHGLIPCTEGTRTAIPAAQQAMLFQRPALLRRSAIENVKFALTARQIPAAQLDERANSALDACALSNLRDQFARSLSGGEQQRLALACAWGLHPRLLFADEPTASLDPNAVRAVESLLLALHAQGTALVMTTHSLAQAKRLAQRIIFLHLGTIKDDVPAAQFFAGEQSPEAKVFFEGERL